MTRSILTFALLGCRAELADVDTVRRPPDAFGAAELPPEPAEPTEGTTGTPVTVPPEEPNGTIGPIEACYPGLDGSWTTCLPLVSSTPTPEGYVYPAPLEGSVQYSEPEYYLDLLAIDEETWLAPNFQLGEFAQSYKGQYAVVQAHAVEQAQALRDTLGALIINSGYRSPDYNASIAGATWSRHMYGDGIDLDPVEVDLEVLTDACYDQGADYVGIYVAHIHCDWRYSVLDAAFYGGARSVSGVAPLPVLDAELTFEGDVLTAPAWGWDEGEPLREWTAYDADNFVIETGYGESFVAPVDAVRVEVLVGRAVLLELDL